MAIVEGEIAIDGLIGEKILPPMPINRRTAHIPKFTLADTQGLRIISGDKWIHAPGTKFERIVAKIGDDTMTVDLRGVEIVVPNEVELDYAGYLSVEAFYAARFGRETSGLTKEALIAAAIFNTSNLGSATNSTVAYTLANISTISFIGDVIASIRRVKAKGEIPDTVVMSGPVFERVRQAATVQGYAAGTLLAGQEANANTILAAFREFGIKQLLIGDTYYNAAADGATPSLTQIWSNTYIAVLKAGTLTGVSDDSTQVPQLGGIGANIFWEGYQNGVPKLSVDESTETFAGGNYVESYPDISIDSMIVRLKMSNRPYIGNARTADLIATQYS